jgi:hypothetical protein
MSSPNSQPTLQTLQFEVVKRLTVPFLIIPGDGTPIYLKFLSPIEPDTTTFSERVRKPKDDGSKNAEPMHISKVVNLQTGEEFRLVAHQVLENTLDESYPNKAYTGKLFEIKKTKTTGKKYFNFDVTEIQLKGSATAKK